MRVCVCVCVSVSVSVSQSVSVCLSACVCVWVARKRHPHTHLHTHTRAIKRLIRLSVHRGEGARANTPTVGLPAIAPHFPGSLAACSTAAEAKREWPLADPLTLVARRPLSFGERCRVRCKHALPLLEAAWSDRGHRQRGTGRSRLRGRERERGCLSVVDDRWMRGSKGFDARRP